MRLLTLLKDAPQLVEYTHFNDKYPQFIRLVREK